MRRLPATLLAVVLLAGGAVATESAVAPTPSAAAKAKRKPVCPTARYPVAVFATCRNGTAAGEGIPGTSGRDRINGGAGDDAIAGGAGADDLTGGPGWDVINGGPGNDVIDARDPGSGRADRGIVCGAGTDTVYADRSDRRRVGGRGTIAPDCERVLYRAR